VKHPRSKKGTLLRYILRGLSLTSALFIFQACYGTPQDFGQDLYIKGSVKAKSTGLPIKGIKVSVPYDAQYYLTDTDGHFSFYTERVSSLIVLFEDIDSTQNTLFRNRDTVLTKIGEQVILDVTMDEK
jgi:hypothetical protein